MPCCLSLMPCCLSPTWGQSSSAAAQKSVPNAQKGPAETPFFCNLKALTRQERHRYEQLSVILFTSVVERRELPDGYALRFPATISMARAAEWVDLERRCCPFFDFRLEQGREQGALWMQLTGRAGVKQFIPQEFRF